MYRPIVEFRDNEGALQEFSSSVSSNPAGYARGEKVTVIFDPTNPADAVIDSVVGRHFATLIFGFLGAVFTLLGGGLLFITLRRRRTINRLQTSGTVVQAKVTGCALDTSLTLNGRHPFRVQAQAVHPATGKLASFQSEPIFVDLSAVLHGKIVPVLIDPKKAGRHYIDLSQWVEEREQG